MSRFLRPRTPPLPEDLARLVTPDDPEWVAAYPGGVVPDDVPDADIG